MKKILFGILIAICINAARAETSVDFSLTGVTVRDVVHLVYGEFSKKEFMLSDDVVNDKRLVSLRMTYSETKFRDFMRSLGYQIVAKDGIEFVSKMDDSTSVPEIEEVLVYTPKNRDADYLLRITRDFVKGKFFGDGVNVQTANHVPDATTQRLVQTADRVVFSGTHPEVERLRSLLEKLDVSAGQVLIEAAVYEVSATKSDGSSLQLIKSLLSSHLGVQLGGAVLANSLTISVGGFSAILSALSSDTRFKTVAHTSLLSRSGTTGVMTVGDQVPVLGAVTVTGSGLSQQSVNYQQSGITLTAMPTIFDGKIDINVIQQISSFVKTATGVNSSPTLNNRQVSASVSVKDGDTIFLGGLTKRSATANQSGIPIFQDMFSNTEIEQTEIVIIMRVSLTNSLCGECLSGSGKI